MVLFRFTYLFICGYLTDGTMAALDYKLNAQVRNLETKCSKLLPFYQN